MVSRLVRYDKTKQRPLQKKQKEADRMEIGKIIRKYRKEKNLTQEEMAGRLGVTAPAVNKWENGNSFPDITLLAPIARLLDITPDTLLSFQKELTPEEVDHMIRELDRILREQGYEEGIEQAKTWLKQYPGSAGLYWQIGVLLDARRIWENRPETDDQDDLIIQCYQEAFRSGDEEARRGAADAMFSLCMRREEYEEAQKYLDYFSKENPERKRKQAEVYRRTGRREEAARTYEELLFSYAQMTGAALHGLYQLALEEKDLKRARRLVEKLSEAARCFEMGRYYEISSGLELAVMEEDEEAAVTIMEELMACVEQLGSFRESFLYSHMDFKERKPEFLAKLKEELKQSFRDETAYGFLRDNLRWRELVK